MKQTNLIALLFLAVGLTASVPINNCIAAEPAATTSLSDSPTCPPATCYRGYTPRAVNSCPCRNANCFDASRYYCGGKQYKKSWLRRWVRAHWGKASMLDAYACECLYPPAAPIRHQLPVQAKPY